MMLYIHNHIHMLLRATICYYDIVISMFQILEKVWQWPKTYKKSRLTHTHTYTKITYNTSTQPFIHSLISELLNQAARAPNAFRSIVQSVCSWEVEKGTATKKDPAGKIIMQASFRQVSNVPPIYIPHISTKLIIGRKKRNGVAFCILPSNNIPFTSRTDRTKRGFLRKSEETLVATLMLHLSFAIPHKLTTTQHMQHPQQT